jgi:hypothetical protein
MNFKAMAGLKAAAEGKWLFTMAGFENLGKNWLLAQNGKPRRLGKNVNKIDNSLSHCATP